MLKFYQERNRLEAGIDEVGRGCLAGRVYAAAVVWPNRIEDYDYSKISSIEQSRGMLSTILEINAFCN